MFVCGSVDFVVSLEVGGEFFLFVLEVAEVYFELVGFAFEEQGVVSPCLFGLFCLLKDA